jgi:hypothetical protein
MALSKPGGRFGHPSADPGREKRARGDKGYQSGVSAGFALKVGGIDGTPVTAKPPVHVGKEKMPNTNMTHGSVNSESR